MTYTYPTNVTGWQSMALYLNTVTGGIFWELMLTTTVITVFIGFATSPRIATEDSIIASGFVGVLLSVILRILGLIGSSMVIPFILMVAVGVIMSHLNQSKTGY